MPKKDGYIHPVALSSKNLKSAVEAAEEVFPSPPYNHNDADAPKRLFPASLHPSDHDYRGLLEQLEIDSLRYWVDIHEDVVQAFTGLYTRTKPAEKGEWWLGWFGVVPGMRNLGIATELLQWTIDKAKRRGAIVLKLYTSDTPHEAVAQKLYDKFGFTTYNTELVVNPVDPSKNYSLIYKRLELVVLELV